MSVIVIIFLFAIGSAMLYSGRKLILNKRIIKQWVITQGTIISKEAQPYRGTILRITIVYEYFVNGQRYQSNNIYRGNPYYTMPSKRNLDDLEFVKNPVVKYDPNNPADSCLSVYTSLLFMYSLIFVGVLLLLIGCMGVLMRVLDAL